VSVFDDATKCCATAVSPAYKQVAPLFCSISQSQPNPSFFRAAQPGDFPRIVQVLNRVNVNGRDISVIPQESPTHAFLGELISTLALSERPRLFLNCCFRWWRRDAGGNLCAQKHIIVRTRSRTMELQQLKGNRVNVQKQECRLKKNLGNEAVRTTGRLPLQHPSPKTMRKATERLPYTRTTQDVSPAASTPSHSLSLLFVGAITFFLEFYQTKRPSSARVAWS